MDGSPISRARNLNSDRYSVMNYPKMSRSQRKIQKLNKNEALLKLKKIGMSDAVSSFNRPMNEI